ncbi:MAG: sigma-70 family RNA polymerase sigma factor [Paludibacter sp.]
MVTELNNEKYHVERLVNGSYKDYAVLYEHYWPKLFAFIYSLSHSRQLAEDIAQDTFLKIWTNHELIDDSLSFKSFIFTIARNKLLNDLRKQINNPLFSDYIELSDSLNLSENNVEAKIDFDEFIVNLNNAKQLLTPRQLEIFQLNKEQGLSVTEISMRFSITEQSVRNQLSKGIQLIKTKFKGYELIVLFMFLSNK